MAAGAVLHSKEWKGYWKIGWPMAITDVFTAAGGFVQNIVVGRLLGTDALTVSSSSLTWMYWCFNFINGFSMCLDTLSSQARGAKNLKLVGTWLQVALVINTIVSIPVYILWFFATSSFLSLIGVSSSVAPDAQTYCRFAIPGYYFMGVQTALEQYFSSVGHAEPAAAFSIIFTFINMGLCYVMIGWFGMGVQGAAAATSISSVVKTLAYSAWCVWWKHHSDYWGGWDIRGSLTLKRLKEYMKLAIPGALGLWVEEAQWQLMLVFNTHSGNIQVALWSIQASIYFLFSGVHIGFAKALNIRVAYYLGDRSVESCKKTMKYNLCFLMSMSGLMSVVLMIFRTEIAHVFTDDPELVPLVYDMVPYIVSSMPLLPLGFTSLFALDGQGRPWASAITNNVSSWCISVPLAALFTYKYELGAIGLIIALNISFSVNIVWSWYLIYTSDWEKYVADAQKRSEVEDGDSDEEGAGSGSDATYDDEMVTIPETQDLL